MNDNRINEAIAILQTMNMEDCAVAIQDLQHELVRVKGIAHRRLDRIAQLQHDVAVLEDKLEDTRSDLKLEQGHRLAQQQRAGILALELAQLEDDPRYLEDEDASNPDVVRCNELTRQLEELEAKALMSQCIQRAPKID
jgi:hypothetical protein